MEQLSGLDATFLNDQGAVLDNYTIIKGDPPVVPVAEFSGSPIMAVPSTPVDLTDESINRPTVWEWDFDNDLAIDSGQRMPSHVYTSSGLYTVSLNVENSAGGDQETKTGYVCVTGGVPGPITVLMLTSNSSWSHSKKVPAAFWQSFKKGTPGLLS